MRSTDGSFLRRSADGIGADMEGLKSGPGIGRGGYRKSRSTNGMAHYSLFMRTTGEVHTREVLRWHPKYGQLR